MPLWQPWRLTSAIFYDRPGRLLRFSVLEGGLQLGPDGCPLSADLHYEGPANPRRGKADTLSKARQLWCLSRDCQLVAHTTRPTCSVALLRRCNSQSTGLRLADLCASTAHQVLFQYQARRQPDVTLQNLLEERSWDALQQSLCVSQGVCQPLTGNSAPAEAMALDAM